MTDIGKIAEDTKKAADILKPHAEELRTAWLNKHWEGVAGIITGIVIGVCGVLGYLTF